jgi:uncharacterized integral membrane protein (TIGR00697 family)
MTDALRHPGRRHTALLIAASCYTACSLIANVMSIRIVVILGQSIDAGTLLYPLVFTLRDVVHKTGGRAAAWTVIFTTAGLNVVMAVGFLVASKLPADRAVGPQTEFGVVLNATWRLVAASIAAQLVSEALDTEVYHRYVRRFGHRAQWGRVVASNAVSIPADSIVFVIVAFAGTDAWISAGAILVSNILLKGATTFFTWPLIYAVRDDSMAEVDRSPPAPRATIRR